MALTDKQQRFVELWTGNASETASLCGYSYPETAGKRCLQNVQICTAIKEKREKEIKPLIATRQDRQKFWSEMMQNDELKPLERMKASELLGKSEADFIEKREHSGDIGIKIRWKRD